MGIVELNLVFLGEFRPVVLVFNLVAADDILD
jgi:hypothetical protein